jgi:hypothetical protein
MVVPRRCMEHDRLRCFDTINLRDDSLTRRLNPTAGPLPYLVTVRHRGYVPAIWCEPLHLPVGNRIDALFDPGDPSWGIGIDCHIERI